MKTDKITDKDISFDNYATFKKCEIFNNGKRLKFTMACGISYEVSLDYLLKWFKTPHYLCKNGNILKWKISKKDDHRVRRKSITVVKFRRVLSRTAVRIYLSNETVYDVPWDTVLMACEKKYEHFGGLTKESKKIVNEWLRTQ